MRLFAKPEPRPLFAKSVLYRIIRALDYYLGFPPPGAGRQSVLRASTVHM